MSAPETKTCCTCKSVKPVGAFSKNASRKDGLQARCKECTSAHYGKNRQQVIDRVAAYKVNNREKVLESKRNYRTKYPERVAEQKRASYEKNKEHYRTMQTAYRAANIDALAEANRRWASENAMAVRAIKSRYKHRRRVLETDNGIFQVTHKDLRRALERAGHCCVYCKRGFGDALPVTWDHVIPVTRGGRYSVGNLVPACGSCNSSKQNRTYMEWRLWKTQATEMKMERAS